MATLWMYARWPFCDACSRPHIRLVCSSRLPRLAATLCWTIFSATCFRTPRCSHCTRELTASFRASRSVRTLSDKPFSLRRSCTRIAAASACYRCDRANWHHPHMRWIAERAGPVDVSGSSGATPCKFDCRCEILAERHAIELGRCYAGLKSVIAMCCAVRAYMRRALRCGLRRAQPCRVGIVFVSRGVGKTLHRASSGAGLLVAFRRCACVSPICPLENEEALARDRASETKRLWVA